jgi:DNA-binding MarR family transcriptional regulator
MVALGNHIVVSCNYMDHEELAAAVRSFVTAFRLDRSDETPCGLPISVSEAFALDVLRDGPLRQQDLAQALGLTKSTVSRLVDDMVTKRLVSRKPGQTDRRTVFVGLLSLGHKRADQLQGARDAKYSALLAAIPLDRHSLVVEALRLLATAAARPQLGTGPVARPAQ